jgi:membrane-associated protease RseP (regulator of RpoE activity)
MPSKLKSLLSVLLTFCIYSWVINWQIALLIVVAISFHEQCHLWAARKLGLKTNNFIMIPFIGGISFTEAVKSSWHRALIVLAGPLLGSLLAILPFVAWLITGNGFLLSATYWILILNVVNLLPLGFLDGGQVMDTITYSINESVGFYCRTVSAVMATIFLYYLNPILAGFVGYFSLSSVYREYQMRKHMSSGRTWMCADWFLNRPERMNSKQIRLIGSVWFGSVVIMGVLIYVLSLHTVGITYYFH